MPSDDGALEFVSRSLIRRLDLFNVTVVGDNNRDIKIYDGEIIMGVMAQNITNACATQIMYRSGGNYDGAVIIVPVEDQPLGEGRSIVYPFGRLRMRGGDIRFTYHGCIIGDEIESWVTIEQRWPV